MNKYTRFIVMIVTATVVMFGLMYLNTYAMDHLFFSEGIKEPASVIDKTPFYLIRIYRAHQTLESIRRRRLVRIGQQVEIPGPDVGELAHVNIVFASADIRQQCYGQEVGKKIGATSGYTVVGNSHKDVVKHDFSDVKDIDYILKVTENQ